VVAGARVAPGPCIMCEIRERPDDFAPGVGSAPRLRQISQTILIWRLLHATIRCHGPRSSACALPGSCPPRRGAPAPRRPSHTARRGGGGPAAPHPLTQTSNAKRGGTDDDRRATHPTPLHPRKRQEHTHIAGRDPDARVLRQPVSRDSAPNRQHESGFVACCTPESGATSGGRPRHERCAQAAYTDPVRQVMAVYQPPDDTPLGARPSTQESASSPTDRARQAISSSRPTISPAWRTNGR
jgi:hypothetical protein